VDVALLYCVKKRKLISENRQSLIYSVKNSSFRIRKAFSKIKKWGKIGEGPIFNQ